MMNAGKFSMAVFALMCTTAFGATDWWNRDTICTIDETRCYAPSTPGLDTSFETGWDISGGCRGKKYICADALRNGGTESVTMERADIINGTGIISDFDINVYVSGNNCYGARKSKNGGAMVLQNGNYVRVWCNGILSNPIAEVANGEISSEPQPTCAALAADGFAAVLNGKCYGKYYSPDKYTIICDAETPTLVILNGANYNPNGRGMGQSDANSVFQDMVATSTNQRNSHFGK